MPHKILSLSAIFFQYETMNTPLFAGLTVHFPAGWTGITGPNGAGKTTLLRIAAGELTPSRGIVECPGAVRYCEQRTDVPVPGLRELLMADDGDSCHLRGRLGLGADWAGRWETLSHGERKRAQIAVALRDSPGVFALDEPTNHVDADTLGYIASALRSFRGIGLLVSHDRELLDLLCRRCVFLEPPGGVVYPGNYTESSRVKREEDAARRERRRLADGEVRQLKRIHADRQREARRSGSRKSKRGLDPHDHDARAKLDGVRVSGRDAVSGNAVRQVGGRLRQARELRDMTPVVKDTVTGIRIDSSPSRRDVLFRMEAGVLPLGPERSLRFPALSMRPEDRVALTGPNGAGKSTLVRHILRSVNIPVERVLSIPQEIEPAAMRDAILFARKLSGNRLGAVMTIVSRLGSDPERLLRTGEPSPGEARKLLLALGMAAEPHLIVMDEPTNHMDLVSVECLEEALVECGGGLLLVSHDFRFLRRLAGMRWILRNVQGGSVLEMGGGE